MNDDEVERHLRSPRGAPAALRKRVLAAVHDELAPQRAPAKRLAAETGDPWRYSSLVGVLATAGLWSLATWSAAQAPPHTPREDRTTQRERVSMALANLLPDLPPTEVARLSRTMVLSDRFSQ